MEQAHGIQERSADDGIAADTYAGGLADAEAGQLIDGFVGERAATADYPDVTLFVNAAGHDPDFAFAGGDDAGAIGADEARFVEVHGGGGANHVDDRNAFGDAHDQRNFGIGGFENGVGRVWRRHKDDAGVRTSGLHCFANRVEHRSFEVLGATFAGSHATYNVGAVFDHLLGVESAFAARETLDDQARFFADQNAHRAPPARATTFCAPSFMPLAMVKLRPLSRRIC